VLTSEHNEPFLEALGNGNIDAGVVEVGVQPLPLQMRARVVAVEPLVLAARVGHPLGRRKTITVDALRDQAMITLVPGSGLRTLLEDASSDAGFTPQITAETNELGSLVELVAEGLGVAVLPRSAVEGVDVAVVRITRPRLQRRTALAWNEATISPAGRAFLALAERHFT
jgi:DNA-binding transcriptional LysR family regulator